MTSIAICLVALFTYLAFYTLVTEVCSVLRARAKPPACPCQGFPAFAVDHDGEARLFTPASPEAAARKVH
ncbi:hypothetical protein ACFQE0_14695 [Methylobacterium komagatae]|uniref:Uncharacterized protein n=1 Tax=Methylobacterium komagatae TaxID=374425 RepID=A0ABW2BJZ8_9HYPH